MSVSPLPPATRALLDGVDGAPFEVTPGAADSPFVILCDHGGNEIPPSLGSLGLSADDLGTHIAWDLGAAAVARRLAALLDGFLAVQRYSRLVIDCNRPLAAADSIVTASGGVEIPGNRGLSPADAAERARAVFAPYHQRIALELARRARERAPTVVVALHTFTPILMGNARPWHVGVLYNRDARLARELLALLRREPGLTVGENEPYSASDETDHSIVEHAERRALPYVELELRQDLVSDADGQIFWAERFARLLLSASATFRS